MIDHKEREALGGEAQKLLDNPLLNYAFKKARDNAINELTDSKADEQSKREHQYFKLAAIKEVEQVIKGMVRDGEVSRMHLNQKPIRTLKSLDI